MKRECRQFRAFRETVRLAQPGSASGTDAARLTAELRETYRETVMSTPDFDGTYGERLAENVANELSTPAADALVDAKPLTGRLKRKLLIQTSNAIERRTTLNSELRAEAEALASARTELVDINDTISDLPDCTVRPGSMETLIDTWDRYDALEDRCQSLLDRRQDLLDATDRALNVPDSVYALNEYVYRDLETPYPVLSAIATTLDRIADAKGDDRPRSGRKRMLTDGEGR